MAYQAHVMILAKNIVDVGCNKIFENIWPYLVASCTSAFDRRASSDKLVNLEIVAP